MPLFRRFGRPGLLGAVARTAVVAGTATMTAKAVSRGIDERARAQSDADRYESEHAHAAPRVETVTSQLATLSALKASGAISDDEFARAKQKVLAAD